MQVISCVVMAGCSATRCVVVVAVVVVFLFIVVCLLAPEQQKCLFFQCLLPFVFVVCRLFCCDVVLLFCLVVWLFGCLGNNCQRRNDTKKQTPCFSVVRWFGVVGFGCFLFFVEEEQIPIRKNR